MKFIKTNISKDSNTKVVKTAYSSSSSSASSSVSSTPSLETHNLWGQPFNGTQDVNGDITINSGKIAIGGQTIETSVDDNDYTNLELKSNTVKISDDCEVRSTLTVGEEIYVGTDVSTPMLLSDNIKNTDTITTKNLTVTGQAHFFELIIDKIKAAGGAIMVTPADGFTVDKVEAFNGGYYLYWQCQDGDGNQRDNMWKKGDQALCMSFNRATVGESYNVSNKYYWCYVMGASSNDNPKVIDNLSYHWIVISNVDKDGEVNPEEGDEIVMLGYRGTDDEARQSALYISAYSSLDSGLKAPLMAQYRGINNFNLASHRKSYYDAVGSKFVGNFEVSGESIEDYINGKISTVESQAPYIGDDGYWYVYDKTTKKYTKTAFYAQGQDGHSPYIGNDTYWYVWNGTSYGKTDISAQGQDGTSVSITKYSITYATTTDSSQPSDDKFTYESYPNVLNGTYVWVKTEVTYSDGRVTKSYSCSKNGTDGKNGTNGKSASYITLKSNSNKSSLAIFNGVMSKDVSIVNTGMTFFAINRNTLDIKEQITYDTFTDPTLCASLISKMQSYDNSYFIALVSLGGCTINSSLAIVLQNFGAASMEIWESKTTNFVFLGIPNIYKGNGFVSWGDDEQVISTYISNGMYAINGGVNFLIDQTTNTLTSQITSIRNDMVTSSLLEQTSNSILAQVGENYVRVGDGNITLNGDTEINGQLTLEGEQGFIMYGDNAVTEISPKAIGSYDEFKSSSSNTIKLNSTLTVYPINSVMDKDKYTAEWGATQDLGKLKKGDTITIKNYSQTITYEGSKINNAVATIYVYEDLDMKKIFPLDITSTKETIGTYTVQNDNYRVTVRIALEGSWMEKEFQPTESEAKPINPSTTVINQKLINTNISWETEVPLNSNYTLIGTEGFGSIMGTDKLFYVGKNGLISKYGENEIRLTNNGVTIKKPNNIKLLDSYPESSTRDTYYVDTKDKIITISPFCEIHFPEEPYESQWFDIVVHNKHLGSRYGNYIYSKYPILWYDKQWGDTIDGSIISYSLDSYGTYRFTFIDNVWVTEYIGH